MRNNPQSEARRWLVQAEDDLRFAALGEELLDTARELDQYYIPTRYPNGLPAGAPRQICTRAQAKTTLQRTERLFKGLCQSNVAASIA